jgi:hypothetical protein
LQEMKVYWLRRNIISIYIYLYLVYLILLIIKHSSSITMALGLTQPLTEMSTRNLPGSKERPVHKVDNFTAICEPTV